ncbi:MAG: 50S ribosomal protein L23 [Mariniblastus sp.]|nr:50S ribosomal protein L23 [Mariniblastus sp.]
MGKVVTKKNRKPPKPAKLVLEPHQVLIKPAVTEKAMFQATELNQYTFKVNTQATKVDIKKAVERLFEVKVTGVSTQVRKGKPRRYKFTNGRTKDWKKAIVTLHPDDKIDFF